MAGDRNGKTAMMLADQRGFASIVTYLQSVSEPDGKEGEDDKKKEEEEKEKGPTDPTARRGSVAAQPNVMYKGLVAKEEQKEKARLSLAAKLADERLHKYHKLEEEAQVAIAAAAKAKEACEEAMRAKQAIGGGAKKKGAWGPGLMAQVLLPPPHPLPPEARRAE